VIRRPGPAGGAPATAVVVTLAVEDDADVDGPRWAALLATVLAEEGVAPGAEVGLSFLGPDAMAELNGEHMGADGPTDVLSFPLDGRAASGATADGPPGMVGDVVVCAEVAAAGAAGHAGSVEDEIALLVVHGALHLLGHDHAEPDERVAMWARERALLAAHHGPLAGDPWADPA
jgi:probable rRNA maturation factor